MSGAWFTLRGMNSFDGVLDRLRVTVDAQIAGLDMLKRTSSTAENLHDALALAREIERRAQLTTITILHELFAAQDFYPKTAGGFNCMLHEGRFTRRELRDYSAIADEIFPNPFLGGAPDLPHLGQALHDGDVSAAGAMEVINLMAKLPKDVSEETRDHVEQLMCDFARTLAPDDLRKAGIKILQGLAADDEPADERRQRDREATLSRQRPDLMSTLWVNATPELHALLSRLFADYAGPGDLLPEGEKANDTRFAGQRRHDALVAALKCALHRNGPMPPTRGCSTIVATMTVEQLRAAAGLVPTDVGTVLPVKDLIRLGSDHNDFLALLEEGTGNLIELGKFKRAADLHAYLGLFASQGGDTTPGSDLPAAMCEIHHIQSWKNGGRSTAGNMGLVGHNTHDLTDDNHRDPNKWWSYCTSTGHLVWQPPAHIDPKRRPRINISPSTWLVPGQMLRLASLANFATCQCQGKAA